MSKTPQSPFQDLLREGRVLVFDGAVGTSLYEKGYYINRPFEELNLSAAADVEAVHRAYIEAGADVITTNTFSITRPQLRKFDIESRQAELLTAGLRIANQAAEGSAASIGLSIGPLGELLEPLGSFSKANAQAEFALVARLATESGLRFDAYLLESFTNVNELEKAVDGIREIDRTRPILASMSLGPGATTIILDFARKIGERPDVEALGFNCSEGPSHLYTALKTLLPILGQTKPVIVQPNAGIPRQINGRYFYLTSPDYMAKYAKRFAELGVSGVGGCCGTGPEHVRAIRSATKMMNARAAGSAFQGSVTPGSVSSVVPVPSRREWSERPGSRVGQVLRAGRKVISIEMMSPKGTDTESFYAAVEKVRAAGVSFVNVPDGARATTRVSSLHIAAAVAHRFRGEVAVIPHFTTRDRNLIALQADLLGASVNGVGDVLLVTGDPPKLGNNKEATAVYDIDSIGLTHLVDCLNGGVNTAGEPLGRGTDFGVGVAANPTAVNLSLEVDRWRYKVDMGADFAVTQPIYEPEALFRWLELIKGSGRPHLVGIWPFVSLRNAEFMANEVPGVSVPKWALEEMAKAGTDKGESIKRGLGIAERVIRAIDDACEGFCISAPLGKVEVALELVKGVSK
jgi:methionine synthase I (cobalamin-dependent)/5,10-methylenetetrahydrofolate reductase